MNEIYKKNLLALQKFYPEIYKRVEKTEIPENISLIKAKSGQTTAQIRLDNDETILLHSKYDPIKESENILKRFITQDYDVLILGGFGLGFLCHAALEYSNFKIGNIVIIEKDIKIFKSALMANDITDIIKNPRVKILIEEDGEIKNLSDYLLNIATKKVFTLLHIPSRKIYLQFYSNLKGIIDSYLQRKNINIATLSRFQNLWVRNIFKNYRLFLERKGISHFFNQFRDLPVIVISAGPSLSDNIELLRENQKRFIIISVDSSFQVLVNNSIYPDFVVTVDPQYINYKYFEYNNEYSPVLISEPSTFPLILTSYKGNILFFSSVFPFVKWLEKFTEQKGEIDMGGSVSTTAFDFAYKIGGNPIILVGQDLAFIKNKTHTKGSFVEKYWAMRYSKFNTMHNGVYKYIHNNLFIKVKSNDNKLVDTDKRLLVFHAWFENKIKNLPDGVRVINTSLSGAKLGDVEVKNLQTILSEEKFDNIENIKNKIKKFNSKIKKVEYIKNIKVFKDEYKLLKQTIYRISPIVDEAVVLSEDMYNSIKRNKKERLFSIVKSLDKIDKKINSFSKVTMFLSLLIQDRIYTILEEYENNLTDEEIKNNELKVAKRNIFLYNGIKESLETFKRFLQMWDNAEN